MDDLSQNDEIGEQYACLQEEDEYDDENEPQNGYQ